MSNKYNKSFDIDYDDIPQICPFCKNELDISDDVDISPFRGGFRSVLLCPSCNYKKVIGFQRETDIEDELTELDLQTDNNQDRD